MTDEPGVRFGIANALLIAALFASAIAGLKPSDTEFLAVIVAGLASVGLSLTLTASIATVAWALITGFVENQYGELTFEQGDLGRLVVFTVSTLALAIFARRIYQVVKENATHE